MPLRHMLASATVLTAFAVVGTGMVATTHFGTAGAIAENERLALLANLNAVVPAEAYDNRLSEDRVEVRDPALLGSEAPITLYRARRNDAPVALIGTPVAPDGYGGAIRLLVGVYADGRIAGVRVLSHRETPGLGDDIEIERSDWIRGFDGRALGDPADDAWAVRRDGGQFDQFTGATVTPRAVVGAVHRFLQYVKARGTALYDPAEEFSKP